MSYFVIVLNRKNALGFIVVLCAGNACRAGGQASVGGATAGYGLSENGAPCALETECASGFCVDAVCCDTACGGGARDAQSCSNIYGAVAGLTNGTCTPLGTDDPCGALTSISPCTWRGSNLNNGGKCPNPPSGESVACFPCTDSSDCNAAFPVCVQGTCVQCDGDFGSGSAAECPSTEPTCQAGQCVGCGVCTGDTPACNVLTSACAPCNGDFGSGATLECPDATAPACLPSGACAECSATETSRCTGATPSCDTTTNTCAGCNGDYGSGESRACTNSTAPLCLANGTCGVCMTSADCDPGLICQTMLGNCGTACTADADCFPNGWCAGGVCTPKLENGSPLPAISPIDATCTPDNGARVCASGVCDTTDNKCGLLNSAPCTPQTPEVCRSGTCDATDNKCGALPGESCTRLDMCRSNVCAPTGRCGDCQTDAECGAAGVICDTAELVCVPGCRGTGGNGCAQGLLCSSMDASPGTCSQCLADSDCGDATSGRVCNELRECVPGCRGADGNSCEPGVMCSSSDGAIGVCARVLGSGCAASSPSALLWIAVSLALFGRRRKSEKV